MRPLQACGAAVASVSRPKMQCTLLLCDGAVHIGYERIRVQCFSFCADHEVQPADDAVKSDVRESHILIGLHRRERVSG